jgi:predicted RNA-binding protein with PIN domain
MRRLIVDGYNVLFGGPRYAELAARDVDAARERLIADLGARVAEGEAVTLVFDGGGNPESTGEARVIGGVTVVFSPCGTDADSVIEALAAEARGFGDETTVVTSDAATRWTALGGSVTVARSPAFAGELADDETGWKEHAAGQGARVTVSDRLDEHTRERLSRMRRGRGGKS